ncbi:MAG: hypothetical protein EB101_07960 [Chitinophagia bacterium]|nr:hypothetical protein [Chitinophagia bacterium]
MILASSFALISPAVAQNSGTPSAPIRNLDAQPISQDLLQKFIALAAINGCMLLQEKIDYKSVLKSGVAAVAGIVYTDYASKISGINGDKPLENNQLAAGVGLDLSIQLSGRCEKLIPSDDLKKLEEYLNSTSIKK